MDIGQFTLNEEHEYNYDFIQGDNIIGTLRYLVIRGRNSNLANMVCQCSKLVKQERQ